LCVAEQSQAANHVLAGELKVVEMDQILSEPAVVGGGSFVGRPGRIDRWRKAGGADCQWLVLARRFRDGLRRHASIDSSERRPVKA
jgi:hypothetical protein